MDDSFLKIFDAPTPFRVGTPEHLGAIVKWMNLNLEDTARAQEVPEWLVADFMATFDQMAILTGGDGDSALLLTQQAYADVDYTDHRQDTEPRWSKYDIFKVYGGDNPKHHAKIAEDLAAFIAGQELPEGTRYMIEAAPGWDLGPNPQRDQYGRRMPPFMLLTKRPGEDSFTPETLNRTVAVPTFIEQPEPTSPLLEGKVNLNPLKQDVPNRLVRGALTNLHKLLRDDDGNYRPGKPFVITGGSREKSEAGEIISRTTGKVIVTSADKSKHLMGFGSTAVDVRESSLEDMSVTEVKSFAVEAGFDPAFTLTPQHYRNLGQDPHWHFGLSDTAANRAGINADQGPPVIVAGRPTAIPLLYRPDGALPQVIADAQEVLNIKSSELDIAALEKQYDDDVARGVNPDQAAYRTQESRLNLPDLMEEQDNGLDTFSGLSAGQRGRL
jgi:hypothetical protein